MSGTIFAKDCVVATIAVDDISTCATVDYVIAICTTDIVGKCATANIFHADEGVVAIATTAIPIFEIYIHAGGGISVTDGIATGAAINDVITPVTLNKVIAITAVKVVVRGVADNGIVKV